MLRLERASRTSPPRGVASDVEALGTWRGLLRGRWPWMALTVGITVAIVWYVQQGNWLGGYFFDEQWRADIVRSERPWERMLLHNTPNPIGWMYVTKWVTYPFGYNPLVYRIVTAAWYALAAGVLALLAMRITERAAREVPLLRLTADRAAGDEDAAHRLVSHRLVPSIGVALLSFSPEVSHYYHYFNNYTFEVLYCAVLVLAVEELGRTRRAPVVVAVLVGLAPLFLVGGLLLVPGVVVCTALWAWREHRTEARAGRTHLLELGVGLTVGALVMALIWFWLYKPIGSKPSIGNYWIGERTSLGGEDSLITLLGTSARQVAAAIAGDNLQFTSSWTWTAAWLATIAAFAVGAVHVLRRWPPLLGVVAGAYGLAVVGSATVHWPMTIERVNLAFTILLFLTIMLGLVRIVMWLARGRLPFVVVGMVILVELLFPNVWAFGDLTFSRPAIDDMAIVGESPARRNVVVTYHQLLHWYSHDALINTTHGDRRYDLIWETEDDPDLLYRDLDGELAKQDLQPGDMVWCLMSFYNGTRNEGACKFSSPAAEEVVRFGGQHVIVLGYRVTG